MQTLNRRAKKSGTPEIKMRTAGLGDKRRFYGHTGIALVKGEAILMSSSERIIELDRHFLLSVLA